MTFDPARKHLLDTAHVRMIRARCSLDLAVSEKDIAAKCALAWEAQRAAASASEMLHRLYWLELEERGYELPASDSLKCGDAVLVKNVPGFEDGVYEASDIHKS